MQCINKLYLYDYFDMSVSITLIVSVNDVTVNVCVSGKQGTNLLGKDL